MNRIDRIVSNILVRLRVPINRHTPYFVLAIGIILTFILTGYMRSNAVVRDEIRFQSMVDDLRLNIEQKIDTTVTLLRAGAALHAAHSIITYDDFREFATRLELTKLFPGIQGLGFSLRIQPEEKTTFIQQMRRIYPDFRIWPDADKEHLHAIVLLQPMDHRNKAAIGFNMFSEPIRRTAMERARDTGDFALSGRVSLVQETEEHKQAGFLIYVPVYRGGMIPSSIQDRRTTLVGFSYSPFRAGDFMESIISTTTAHPYEFAVYDGDQLNRDSLLYSTEVTPSSALFQPVYQTTFRLEFGGRPWTVHVRSSHKFPHHSSTHVYLVVFIGFLISVLLFLLTQSRVEAHLVAEQHAKDTARQAERLARSNAELERFAYVASHDLQEPLRKIASYVDLFAHKYKDQVDNNARQYITYITDGVSRMNKLIQSLLAFSRVERGPEEKKDVGLNVILDGVLTDLETSIRKSDAVVTYGQLPTVWANPVQMHQLFQNLIGNAIKFHAERRPEVTISCEENESEWIISVTDNGIGIDKKYVHRIFEVFQRLHSAKDYPGAGIGLSICKKIVENHDGHIRVESEPGRGSTFLVSLPKQKPNAHDERKA